MIKGQTVSTSDSAGLKRYTDALAPYMLTVLRLLVGITFLLMGLPKLGNLAGFTGFVASLGFPVPGFFAVIVAALEVGGGLLLIAGLATRWVSLLFAIEMLVTTLLVKLPNQGFLAPQGKPGTGAVFDLLMLVGALVLLTHGAGQLSIERNVLRREL
jgi:putative oxidoreductase